MYCSSCRSEMRPGTEFCPKCGIKQAHGQPPQGFGQPQQGSGFHQQGPGYSPQGYGFHQPGYYPGANAPRGKTMLRVIGILYIVFAVFSFFSSAAFLLSADYWDMVLPIAGGMSWSTYYSVAILSSLYSLTIGILAVVFCGKPEKAGLLKILAIISIVRVFAWYAFALQSGALAAIGFTGLSLIGLPIDLILPVLFLIGAHRNQQSAGTPRHY